MQSKCEKYWCDEINKPFDVPDRGFTVTITGKKMYASYEIRDMTIRCVSVHAKSYMCTWQIDMHNATLTSSYQAGDQSTKPLKLKHFFFTAWPDHGVPHHPYSLIKFIQHVRKVVLEKTSPLVVHCRCVNLEAARCGYGCLLVCAQSIILCCYIHKCLHMHACTSGCI